MLGSDYMFRAIFIPFLIMALAALGVNILVGYCGQISLGSGAFMAVGAYAAFNFFVRVPGMPLLVAWFWAVCAPAAFGILFGLPSLRVKGLYLAVATLAAQFFSDWMFLRIKWFTNDSPSGSVSVSGHAGAWANRSRARFPSTFCACRIPGGAWPCWPRTWCVAPSVASGWPSATWTWLPP
jgi:branched-chain amino acid transport system permease protein